MSTTNDEWVADIARRLVEREAARSGQEWTEERKAEQARKMRIAWATKTPEERAAWARRAQLGQLNPVQQEKNAIRWEKRHRNCEHGRGYAAMRRCEKQREEGQ